MRAPWQFEDPWERLASRHICYYAAIPIAIAAIGAYASIQAGDAQKSADDFNAQVEEQQAANATAQANAQAQIDEQNTRRQLGQIAADYAAAGVDPNQGTALDVMSDQHAQGELTKQITLYQGRITNLSYLTQAQASTFAGRQAQQAGYWKAASTILSAAGSSANSSQGVSW